MKGHTSPMGEALIRPYKTSYGRGLQRAKKTVKTPASYNPYNPNPSVKTDSP